MIAFRVFAASVFGCICWIWFYRAIAPNQLRSIDPVGYVHFGDLVGFVLVNSTICPLESVLAIHLRRYTLPEVR